MLGDKNNILDHTPVAIKIPIKKGRYISQDENYSVEYEMDCTGKGVYIGLITLEDIDYTDNQLLDKNKSSRVRCIWEQEELEEGKYYLPGEKDIKIGDRCELRTDCKILNDTLWLILAGGGNQECKSMAKESEFLISKIKSAPHSIKNQYSLDENVELVCVSDILIGVKKLIEIARLNDKPIVIYIPYNYVLSSINGTNKYDKEFREISYMEGVTLVMPSGEEADKMHRENLKGDFPRHINIKSKRNNQIITGKISSETGKLFDVSICPKEGIEERIYIGEAGEFKSNYGTIFTTGICWEKTGQLVIMFRIVQQRECEWDVIVEGDNSMEYGLGISLAEGSLSDQVTLSTSTVMNTMNIGIYKWGAIGVGSFDIQAFVTMRSSGRTSPKYVHRLDCVADGKLYLNKIGENGASILEGTSLAASKVVGAVALLYEYYIQVADIDYTSTQTPNTHMMKRWLRGQLNNLPEQEYPNMSQGYGILDIRRLSNFVNGSML